MSLAVVVFGAVAVTATAIVVSSAVVFSYSYSVAFVALTNNVHKLTQQACGCELAVKRHIGAMMGRHVQ